MASAALSGQHALDDGGQEERLRALVLDARARVEANRVSWSHQLAAIGALPPSAIAPSTCTDMSGWSAGHLLDEHSRIVAAWKLERAAWQARLVVATASDGQRKVAAKRPRLDGRGCAVAPQLQPSSTASLVTRSTSGCAERNCVDGPAKGQTREQLALAIRAGHRRAGCEGALTSQQAQGLLRWAEERLANGDPYTVMMAGRSPQKLHHLKLMFGVPDERGLLPIYNFGLTKAGWKRVAPMPELLQERANEIGRAFGATPNNCVVNIYLTGADYIAPHQDQAFSNCGGKYESKLPVIIDRVGAARDLVFHALDGIGIGGLCMQHGESYILPGPLNMLVKHSVPACNDCGLCVTFSWRCVRNRVSPDGKFAVVNEKPVPLDYLQRALEKEKLTELQAKCDQYGVDATGKKADLVQRLSGVSAEARQQLEVAVLAGGHTPKAPVATRALRVQGPELAERMLTGGKVVENRSDQLGLGWWVVVVGVDRNWREAGWAQPFKAVLDTVPTDEALSGYYGHAVGLIYLSEYRTQVECNGYRWAGRDYVCHVVSHAAKFKAPIKIKPPTGFSMQKWPIEPEEEPMVIAQLPADVPICHDLTPINEPEEEPSRSSNEAAPLAPPLARAISAS